MTTTTSTSAEPDWVARRLVREAEEEAEELRRIERWREYIRDRRSRLVRGSDGGVDASPVGRDALLPDPRDD